MCRHGLELWVGETSRNCANEKSQTLTKIYTAPIQRLRDFIVDKTSIWFPNMASLFAATSSSFVNSPKIHKCAAFEHIEQGEGSAGPATIIDYLFARYLLARKSEQYPQTKWVRVCVLAAAELWITHGPFLYDTTMDSSSIIHRRVPACITRKRFIPISPKPRLEAWCHREIDQTT